MSKIKQYSWFFLLLFTVIDFLIPYILGLFYPHYRPFHQVISDLGEAGSPVKDTFRWTSVIVGLLLILALPGIYQYFSKITKRGATLLIMSLAAFGVGQCLLSGLFSVSRLPSGFDLSMFIHQAGSAIGTIGMLLVPLVLAVIYGKANSVNERNIYLILFAISLLFSGINGLSQAVEFTYKGVWQRISMLCMYLPTMYLALSLKINQK
ncbi:DUF998 domain-containing protein [Enterococcus sp. LJL99]